MNTRNTILLAALSLFAVTTAQAEDLWNQTTADTTATRGSQVSVAVDSSFELTTERALSLPESDVIATWQRAGGVQPTPFRILIPAGCFVSQRDRFVVRDTSCGIQVFLDSELLEADVFSAIAVPPEPVNPSDPLALSIRLTISADSARASKLLSTLGGAEVSLTVGRESGIAVPKSIDAFSGIEPVPF